MNFPIWVRAAIDRGIFGQSKKLFTSHHHKLSSSQFVSILFLGVDSCKQYQVFENAFGFTEQVIRLKNAVLGVR